MIEFFQKIMMRTKREKGKGGSVEQNYDDDI